MQNLAKKKTTFSRDIPFISTCFIVNTNKCKVLEKKKTTFLQDNPFIFKNGDGPARLTRVCLSLLKWLKNLSQKL